ncbi:MAG: choice-of-anchor tandem repeat GloVer-containing protein [Bacteroidota bacterium]
MKKNISNFLYISLLFFNLLFAQKVSAQLIPGELDTTFNSIDKGYKIYGNINVTALQADEKILIGGIFTNYNGMGADCIGRINIDGSFDNSFNVGKGFNSTVNCIAIQSDGKILIGGSFTLYNGIVLTNRIARLNIDGSIDSTFLIGTGCNNTIYSIAIQADGKILIGGDFTIYNGITANRITRLNPNGTLDTTFTSGTKANGTINRIALQTDGKIIIGGNFTTYNGVTKNRIIRLDIDGNIDNSFSSGTGSNNVVNSIAIQFDGKILIGGSFTVYNSITKNRILRLNTDGSIDNTFTIGTGTNNSVSSIKIQADNKVIIIGNFTTYGGSYTGRGLCRLNSDGTKDNSYSNSDPSSTKNSVNILTSGKIIISGNEVFSRGYLKILNTDGSADNTFHLGITGANDIVYTSAVQSDGKIIIGGDFTSYNGSSINKIARLNVNGSIDSTFTAGSAANNTIFSIVLQNDGKILIGGNFTTFNGTNTNRICRLNPNGSIDNTFLIGTGANDTVRSILVQNDGKILIAGKFNGYNGIAARGITRLNNDGTIDNTFDVGSSSNYNIYSIVMQANGKVIVGGNFSNYIARFNTDGTLDNTFNIGSGFNNVVHSLVQQNDGKVIITGNFGIYNGIANNRIARINPDGSLDGTFYRNISITGKINSTLVQASGKILIAGNYTTYDAVPTNRVLRLNNDGTIDNTFNVGKGPDINIYTLASQSDDKIIIGGLFNSFNNLGKNNITRLIAGECLPSYNTSTITECNSYSWHDSIYTTSGIYTYSYLNQYNCQNIDTLNLTITTYSSTHNSQNINACNNYLWNGTVYNKNGTYVYSYANANGCTSSDTLHLTINNTYNAETIETCANYLWNGSNYNTSGIYTYSYTNTNGCFSVDTLHLNIIDATNSSQTVNAYNSYKWHGTTYNTSGTYIFNYPSGCSKVDTLNLTISYITFNEPVTELFGMTSYGQYSNSGIFKIDFNNNFSHVNNNSFLGEPHGSLTQTLDGKIYGMTLKGGINGHGSIFEVDPISRVVTTKIQFNSTYTGAYPYGNLVQATNGKLYGLTTEGGSFNKGVIFEYDPISNSFSIKFHFNGEMGRSPYGSLMQANNGKFYGMTCYGGVNDKGVLFEYDPYTNVYIKRIDFNGCNGSHPRGGLMQSTNGKLYGLTKNGGSNNCRGPGTIFEFNISNNQLITKHEIFGVNVGLHPNGDLIEANNGKLYGLTTGDSDGDDYVVGYFKSKLFEFDPLNNTYSEDYNDNFFAYGSLLEASNGKLYGLSSGGNINKGRMFRYDITSQTLTNLIYFDNNTGWYPYGNLIEASVCYPKYTDTTIISCTAYTLGSNTYTKSGIYTQTYTNTYGCSNINTLHLTINPKVCSPIPAELWGMTNIGGANNLGTIFKTDGIGNNHTVVFSFDGAASGSGPNGSLMQATNGNFYGVTTGGGSNNMGTLFEYNPKTNVFTKKIDFNGLVNGSWANGALLQATNGKLYGVASAGGTYNSGVLFEYDPLLNLYIKKLDFEQVANGRAPIGKLIQATNGKLYGLTNNGGTFDRGVFYEYDLNTNTYSKKLNFSGTAGEGKYAYGSIVQAENGKLYGMTGYGGINDFGIIFEHDPITNITTKKVDFNGYMMENYGSFVEDAAYGNLYAMSNRGGTGLGVLFAYNIAANTVNAKNIFNGINGSRPSQNDVLLARNRKLYGLTKSGGNANLGVLYEYDIQSETSTKKIDFIGVNGSYPSGSLIETYICYPVYKDSIIVACNSFVLNTSTYTTSGNYSQVVGTTTLGCDSILNLNLTILSSYNSETITECTNYEWHATTYTTSGVYTYGYTNSNACASVDTLHLTINYSSHNSETITACNNYGWHATTYTTSGVYTYSYNNTNGCASVDTLHLTINNSTHNAEITSACNSYTWHGTAYTASGIYTYSYSNTNSCASLDTLYLTISNTYNVTSQIACNSYVWHGNTYTVGGTKIYTYTNGLGCLSADTLNLTIDNGTHNNQTISACGSYLWHATTYTTSGVYTYNYTNANGCPSADKLNLIINNPQGTPKLDCIAAQPICNNHYFESQAASGEGCSPYDEEIGGSSCLMQGEKNGFWYSFKVQSSGTFEFTIDPLTNSTDYDWALFDLTNATCADIFNNPTLEVSCNYSGSVAAANGNTGISSTITGSEFESALTLAAGRKFVLYVSNYTQNIDGYDIYLGGTATYIDTQSPTITSLIPPSCGDSNVVINFSEPILCGNLDVNYFTITGPDGLHNVELNYISPNCTNSNNNTYVTNASVKFEPPLTALGIYTLTLTQNAIFISDQCGNYNQTATIPIITFSVAPITNSITTISQCNNYVWNATTYTTSGIYTYNYTNANGCASVDILNLTIKNSTASTINAVACSSYTLNAQTYTASNTYTQIIPNAVGCDSTITINLTIDPCSPVWPGDANDDFVADNFDILNIGLAYGATSYTRNAANNNWIAQPSLNWLQNSSGVDYKHSDCDGNGIINDDDTLAIYLNYGQTHSKSDFSKSTDSDPVFSLQFDSDTIVNDAYVVAKIYLGDVSIPANNVYGIAFSINYDSQYIKENSCYVSFNNIWLGDVNTNLITFQKDQYLNSVTHVAVTRKNHTNVSGNGEIGEFHFKTKDVISGANDLNINLSNVKLIDNTGFVINVQNQGDVIVLKDKLLSVESNTINKNSISIYPNPNNGLFTISATSSLIGADIKITTVTGQIISENHIENASIININLSKEANGFYFVEINQDGKSQRFKLIKN